MTERPILFSGAMIRAILQNKKQQTRRVVKPQPEVSARGHLAGAWLRKPLDGLLLPKVSDIVIHCPYGQPGDRLWVRETLGVTAQGDCEYMADRQEIDDPRAAALCERYGDSHHFSEVKGVPSIFMSRWACRIVLEVTGIRVERLFDISEEDARAEGMMRVPFNVQIRGEASHGWTSDEGQPVSTTARRAYEDLWHSINGAWLDCWVWVVEFRRAEALKAAA